MATTIHGRNKRAARGQERALRLERMERRGAEALSAPVPMRKFDTFEDFWAHISHRLALAGFVRVA